MSLERLYASRIEESIQRQIRNPGPAPEPPSFSLWSTIGAGFGGLPAGGLESVGSTADLLSGFGTASAAMGGSAGGMFSPPTDDERRQQDEARARLRSGKMFDTTAGNVLRRRADEFMPNPETSHTADQVVAGLTRFAGKAVAAVGTMGPVAGSAVLGLEEGNTAAQRLIADGVDPVTAAKVGAVHGSISAVGAVLPISGAAVPGSMLVKGAATTGLVAAGGPVAFMAEEGISREILQRAGYDEQALQHDPLDPLGLAISTILPAAFGAVGMRGAVKRGRAVESGGIGLPQMTVQERRGLKYGDARLDQYAQIAAEREGVPPAILLAIKNAGEKSNPTATSPKGAQGVMQFMPATAKEMGIADPTDPIPAIDGGARYMRKLFDAYGSWDAAVAHYNGGGSQAALVRGGAKPSFPETAAYLERVQQYVREHTTDSAAARPEVVDAARVQVLNETLAKNLPDVPDAQAQVMRAADLIGAGERIEFERASLGRAYDEVRANPIGADDDPLVRLTPEGIGDVLVERGPNFPATGDLEVKAGGYGLVKVIWKHGEGSNKAPESQVTRDDVLALPEVLRNFEPVDRTGGAADPDARDLRFVVDRPDGRRVVYAAARFAEDGERRVVTIHVDERKAIPPSPQREMPSERFGSGTFEASDAGTAAAPFSSASAQRGGQGFTVAREASNALPAHDSVTVESAAAKPAADSTRPASGAAGSAKGAAPSLDTQLAQKLATEQPDMRVILPGSDEPISLREAMERIREEEADEAADADLVRVAAECALTA